MLVRYLCFQACHSAPDPVSYSSQLSADFSPVLSIVVYPLSFFSGHVLDSLPPCMASLRGCCCCAHRRIWLPLRKCVLPCHISRITFLRPCSILRIRMLGSIIGTPIHRDHVAAKVHEHVALLDPYQLHCR